MEEWRTVVYNGEVFENYEVSNTGKVRSLNYNGTGRVQELKQNKQKTGYFAVRLYGNGKSKTYRVHRMVACTFIPNDEPTVKTVVNHLSEDKTDNHVSNLEWTTPKKNIHHGTCIERKAKAQGKKVLCVETGVVYPSIAEASRQTGLSHNGISMCCRGQYKQTHGYHWKYVE